MQISSFYVQVFFLIFHKEESRECIDKYSHTRYPSNSSTGNNCRIIQLMNTFDDNGAYGYQQNDCIEQGYQDRTFFITIRISFIGFDFGQAESQQCQHETNHIA